MHSGNAYFIPIFTVTDQITMAEIRDVFLSIVIKSYLGDSITCKYNLYAKSVLTIWVTYSIIYVTTHLLIYNAIAVWVRIRLRL